MLARIDSPVHDGRMERLRLYSLGATLISRLNTRLKELFDNRARVPEMGAGVDAIHGVLR